jgi:hypothetical protein
MNEYFTNIKTSPTQRAVIIAVSLIVLIGFLYIPPIYRTIGADVVLWIEYLINLSAALISVWLGFLLWRSFHKREILRMIWGSLTSGLILWTIADLIWGSEQLLLKSQPHYSSSANIAWILGYFAVIVGLTLRLYTFQIRPKKLWQFAVLAAFGVLTILVIVYIIIPILNDAKTGIFYEKFVNLFYPIADLILAFLALLLFLVLDGGLLSKPWAVIAMGCFFIAISDLVYAFATWQGIYQGGLIAGLDFAGYVINLSFTLAYVLTALGLYLQARLQGAI